MCERETKPVKEEASSVNPKSLQTQEIVSDVVEIVYDFARRHRSRMIFTVEGMPTGDVYASSIRLLHSRVFWNV